MIPGKYQLTMMVLANEDKAPTTAKIQPNDKNTTGMATSAHKPKVRPYIKLYLVDINTLSLVF